MIVKIPVSVGELVDKITILEIKNKKIKNIKKLSNIKLELKLLNEFFKKKKLNTRLIKKLKDYLYNVNLKLWIVEDKLRDHEYRNKFNQDFVKLARKVYFLNDKRSKIKKDINEGVGSKIIEEKSYKEY